MATQSAATVRGGFWPTNGVSSLASLSGKNGGWRRAFRALQGYGTTGDKALIKALNGVVPGSLASASFTRVAAVEELGGKRTTESISFVNRNTTTQDRDDWTNEMFNRMSTRTSFGNTPPANKDGNPLGTR